MAALAVAGGAGAGSKAWGQSEMLPAFKPPATYLSGGKYPFGVAAGDVTGGFGGAPDGLPEIAVACGHYDVNRVLTQVPTPEPSALVRILKNTGHWDNPADGLEPHHDLIDDFNNFSGGLYYAKTVPAEVRFAHMNPQEDDFLDLIVSASALDPTDPHFDPDNSTWGVYVFLWSANLERFVLKDHYVTPLPVRGLAVADFDNDGLNDVAVATDLNLQANLPMDMVYVLRNDPQDPGRFADGVAIVLDIEFDEVSADVVAAEFNRTGGPVKLDLTTANWVTNDVSVLTNHGALSFSPANLGAPCGSWRFSDLAVGRFTAGSIRNDVAGIVSEYGLVQILHGDGRGNFAFDCSDDMLDTYDLAGGGAPVTGLLHGIAVGNLNLGTRPDIVVTRPGDPTSQVSILLGKGDGRFQYASGIGGYHKSLDIGSAPFSAKAIQVICADLNQDGRDDIVTANHDSHSISVLINSTQQIP
ncbi:MAG: VCBS repeat-containing protein [Phycisphaerales bacterium]|nr:VCBS repeat-containing protein [Phycisphaerales bacterium]